MQSFPSLLEMPSLQIAPSTILFKQPLPSWLVLSKHPPFPASDTPGGVTAPPQSRPFMLQVLVRNCYFTRMPTHHGVTTMVGYTLLEISPQASTLPPPSLPLGLPCACTNSHLVHKTRSGSLINNGQSGGEKKKVYTSHLL